MSLIPAIEAYLHDRLFLKLHPNKRYIQNVDRGVAFVGAYIKPYRRYVSRRTVKSLEKCFCSVPDMEAPLEIRAVLNSYLGYLTHFRSYRLRRSFVQSHPWLFCYGGFPVSYSRILLFFGHFDSELTKVMVS